MCLYINKNDQQPIKVAETDITCYKILEECKLEGCPYMSPYVENPIPASIMIGLYPYVALGEKSIKCIFGSHPFISEGYIHTYKSKIVAEEMLDICQNRFENDCHLFECKIPAGTQYYEGLDDNFLATYASDKIVFVSEI